MHQGPLPLEGEERVRARTTVLVPLCRGGCQLASRRANWLPQARLAVSDLLERPVTRLFQRVPHEAEAKTSAVYYGLLQDNVRQLAFRTAGHLRLKRPLQRSQNGSAGHS